MLFALILSSVKDWRIIIGVIIGCKYRFYSSANDGFNIAHPSLRLWKPTLSCCTKILRL